MLYDYYVAGKDENYICIYCCPLKLFEPKN